MDQLHVQMIHILVIEYGTTLLFMLQNDPHFNTTAI